MVPNYFHSCAITRQAVLWLHPTKYMCLKHLRSTSRNDAVLRFGLNAYAYRAAAARF